MVFSNLVMSLRALLAELKYSSTLYDFQMNYNSCILFTWAVHVTYEETSGSHRIPDFLYYIIDKILYCFF